MFNRTAQKVIVITTILLLPLACAGGITRVPGASPSQTTVRITEASRTRVPLATVTPPSVSTTTNAGNALPGDYAEQMLVDGQARQYRIHVPRSYRPDQPIPLVINLHGYSSNAAEQERVSQMSSKADQAGFIVVHPEGLGSPQTWHVGPRSESEADLLFLRDMISQLQSRFSIDPARIYVTGISNGAQMANRLGCELSEVVAAIGPVSGGYPPSQECNPSRPVPIVAFHGTEDKLIPYEGQGRLFLPAREWAAGWAARNGCDPTPVVTFQKGEVTGETWSNCKAGADVTFYTIFGRGHSWPGSVMPAEITTHDINATDVIWEFFIAHPMPAR